MSHPDGDRAEILLEEAIRLVTYPDMSSYPDGVHTSSQYVVGGMFVETYPAADRGYHWRVVRSPGQALVSAATGTPLALPPLGRHSASYARRDGATFLGRDAARRRDAWEDTQK